MSEGQLVASLFSIPQEEPKEGRLGFNLNGASYGGAPANGILLGQPYTWVSDSFSGPQKPSSIISAWLDGSQITSGQSLQVQIGSILYTINAGVQLFQYTPSPMPCTVIIYGAGLTGYFRMALFNYNVFRSGVDLTEPIKGLRATTPGATP